ncbi:CYTH domain-containing protein [Methylorubrum rhodesianum]|jgi:CYTH domain-containing protein|uniref:CYTH domain-containing protein n=1 Tax=Methylorubrum TaxID=2282523 RepID=UPI00129C316F|nr:MULTISPECIES: CYTH domain-containing protein [Methylorubrum]MBY0142830.1 CYTH domain-containing protein [Methylorubrum populi]MRI52827.1 CYTH domain-containing protein [Methylobacterium sp. DB1607]MBB5762944.1 CYTH domain-containing protein [Methylorubrum rhodesianum]MBI1688766.1 CYTH domain-containing protein [Methylorubrum sp. DB1722]MBK3404793.1 CYTH domain-containing protein [Methylorubrum rhodesianum]
MRFEVERKFLVADEGWRTGVTSRRRLTDGLIGQFATGNKVRVRLDDDRAWLTVKGERVGLGRPEFEYEIPRADAQSMLSLVCDTCFIEKTRHCVPHAGLIWEVDVYGGTLTGMILAEVELDDEGQSFERPAWLGREVTGDPRFRQSALLRRFGDAGRIVTPEEVLALPL